MHPVPRLARRTLLRLTGIAAGAAALASCGATPTPQVVEKEVTTIVEKEVTSVVEKLVTAAAPAAAEPVEITWWSPFGPNYGGHYEEIMMVAFKALAPHIKVNRVDMLEREKVQAEFAAGRFPDLMPWYYPEIKSAERQLALDDLVDRDQWDICQMWLVFKDPADDKTYGLNQEVSNMAIWYDRAVLTDLGVEEPSNPDWTWEEFADWAQVATVDNNGKNAKDPDFQPDNVRVFGTSLAFYGSTSLWPWIEWLWQAGGEFYNADETQVTFDSPEGIEALQYWVDMIHKYRAMPVLGSAAGGLGSGLLASADAGCWTYGSLVRSQGKDVGTIDLPMHKVKASLQLPGYWHLLNNGSANVDASWELLKYRLSVDNVLVFSKGAGYLPVRRDVAESEGYASFLETEGPQLKTHVKLLGLGRVQPTTHLFRPELMQIHGEWFEKALLAKVSAEEAMKSAATEINARPDLFEQNTRQGPAC